MNADEVNRITELWSKLAQEPVHVEMIHDRIYGICNELAALRLEHQYKGCNRAKAFFSKPLNSWCFALTPL